MAMPYFSPYSAMLYGPLALLVTAFAGVLLGSGQGPKTTFEIRNHEFLLDGKPFQFRSGEIHMARIPREYWRQRLKMAKAMGLNSVGAYIFWNFHETEKGKFDFTGDRDVHAFIKMAQEEGLWVLLRPGPYVCAEWDFGGYPYWLLTEPGVKIRSNNPLFLKYCKAWLDELGKQVADLQVTHGGNILMVQVENEYGSYGDDKEYMGAIRDMIRGAGFDVPLYTCDGGSQIEAGHIEGALPGYNGGMGDGLKQTIDKFAEGGPYIVPEYYPGWLCHWGEKFPTKSTENVVRDIDWYLSNNVSFNIYMWHGGTNFGYWAGANMGGRFQPDITSYDYDAPLSEAGHATEKFMALRKLIQEKAGEKLPTMPPAPPVIEIPKIELSNSASALDVLPKPISSDSPKPMEYLGQGYGFILYRTRIAHGGKLSTKGVRDFAVVMLDGKTVGTLDRRWNESQIDVPARGQLDILVENWGRINFGHEMEDNLKGLVDKVTLDGQELRGWQIYPLPDFPTPQTDASPRDAPTVYAGHFNLAKVGDTWLDMRAWRKGVVWVNGRNLGRFVWVGPQQTLYCPGPYLKKGENEILVFDMQPSGNRTIWGLDHPILEETLPERARPKRPEIKPVPEFNPATALAAGEFPLDNGDHDVRTKTMKARYICFEALSSYNGDFASMAELWLLDAAGNALSRSDWKVVYCDSEETSAENGIADNMIDDDPETIWHSVWSQEHSSLPHRVVIDLGRETAFAGFRVRPRQASHSAITRGYRFYAVDTLR
jgi:beta-galactosidase